MSTGRVGYGKELSYPGYLNYPGYLGQCTVRRVSYLGKVKQGNYHTHVIYHTEPKLHISHALSFYNNLPYPPPGFGRVLLCASINTILPWLPTYPYPSIVISYLSTYPTLPTVGKIPLPTLSIYPTYPIHVTSAYIPVPTSHYLILHTPACISLPVLLSGLN